MRDVQHELIQRELFLATFGSSAGSFESWVSDRLASLLEEQVCRAGKTLFVAGDPPDFYYLLRRGRVELVREGSAPWVFEGPSVFGMADALLERPRARTALAKTDIEAMKLPSEAWLEILEDSFPLARAAVHGFVGAVAKLEERLWATGGRTPVPMAPPPAGPLDVIERLAVLAQTPLLRSAGVQTLSDLAAASEVTTFQPGEVLVERAKPSGRVLLLLEGEVGATREEPRVEWSGGPGEIICGTAAFAGPILAWEARARTEGRVLSFRVSDWLDLMEEHFDMVRAALAALSLEREELLDRLQGSQPSAPGA